MLNHTVFKSQWTQIFLKYSVWLVKQNTCVNGPFVLCGKVETSVQQWCRDRRPQGKRSPLYTAGPTGSDLARRTSRNLTECFVVPLTLPELSWLLSPGVCSREKEGSRASGHPAITCCAGAQWKAVAGEKITVSHHCDPPEREGGAGNALPLVTNSNSQSLLVRALATPRLPSLLAVSSPLSVQCGSLWFHQGCYTIPRWLVLIKTALCMVEGKAVGRGWEIGGAPVKDLIIKGQWGLVFSCPNCPEYVSGKEQEVTGDTGISPYIRGIRGSRMYQEAYTISTGVMEGAMIFLL